MRSSNLATPLTDKQIEFLNILYSWEKKHRRAMPRYIMREHIGLGIDHVAFALRFKGFIDVVKKGRRVYYKLKGHNLGIEQDER